MSQLDEVASRLAFVEPYEGESISHYLGRLRRFKANSLPSAYSLGTLVGIPAVIARWEKLYFNPFPREEELAALSKLINVDVGSLYKMLPPKGVGMWRWSIRLCGACYAEAPCHQMEWQFKTTAGCDRHQLRLLSKCPNCDKKFDIPALWEEGVCQRCRMEFKEMARYQKPIV
ncbi:TniQ family protein [Phormidium sp. LEGE 05292]|uniref:TniQ family protein n=1 Tax=[Phormidium] sp. LEGE 05292 TaxID=767427 RepID=UPI001880475D|nr:TniQ family protein [Phormidium sp. LEGE 05292]MBE9224009.1 TniQ family protein [Phormidium sp. LEGE 05292]